MVKYILLLHLFYSLRTLSLWTPEWNSHNKLFDKHFDFSLGGITIDYLDRKINSNILYSCSASWITRELHKLSQTHSNKKYYFQGCGALALCDGGEFPLPTMPREIVSLKKT